MTTPEARALYDHAHQLEASRYRLKSAEQAAHHRSMSAFPDLADLKRELDRALEWVRAEREKVGEGLSAEGLPWP